MTVYEIQSPRGKTYEIEADSMPSGAQLQALLHRMEGNSKPEPAPEQPSAVSRFASNAWEMLNPVSMVKGAAQAIAHPIDTAQAMVDAQSERAVKAYDLAKEGRYSEAAGNAGAAVLPVIGPIAAGIGEQAGTGDIAGAAGKLTGLLALPAAAKGTARVGKAAAPIAGDVATGLGKVISDPGTYTAIMSGAGTGAAVGGSVIGYPAAATAGAITAATLKASPEIFKAVKAGLMARKGISGAQAEAALLKMPAEELAATVQAVVEPPPVAAPVAAPAKASAEQVLQAQNAYKVQQKIQQGNPPARAYSYEQAGLPVPPEVAAAEASRIRPIPPNKLPPVLPDPVVREIAPAPKPVVTPEAPAVAPAVDEAAARAARQKQHIEDSYKAKAEKDAKNVAAEDNLLFDLERSIEHLKKRGPEKPAPSPAQSIAEKVKERVLSMKKQGMSRGQMKSSVLEDILRRQDGYRPSEVQRAVDLVLKEGVDAPPVPKTATKPAEFAAKVAENKTKGADLAAALEESPVPQIDSVRSAIVGKRVYTKEGESAVESAKAEARRVINAEYPDPKTRADAIEEALAKVEQVEHEADKAGRSRVIAKAEMRRITEFSSDPSMAKKQRAYNERLSAYEASRNPSEPQIIDGKIVYVPAPDKRTAMLDTAKAKLKKKKKE